jgi:hypothetical protein
MIDFSTCEDIYDFYLKTGMNRQEAFVFLLKELKEIKEREKNYEKECKRKKQS